MPCSNLAPARLLRRETPTLTLGNEVGAGDIGEDGFYRATTWTPLSWARELTPKPWGLGSPSLRNGALGPILERW